MADDDRHQGAGSPDGHTEAGPDALDDVRRGIVVYREMLNFEQEILERMRRWARSRPVGIRRAVEVSDIEPMQVLIEQFRERLSYWQERDRQLRRP